MYTALAHSWCFSVNRLYFFSVLLFFFFISFLLVKRYQKRHCFWRNLQIIQPSCTHINERGSETKREREREREKVFPFLRFYYSFVDEAIAQKNTTHHMVPHGPMFLKNDKRESLWFDSIWCLFYHLQFQKNRILTTRKKHSQISDDFQLP